jgi:hypothetical protein
MLVPNKQMKMYCCLVICDLIMYFIFLLVLTFVQISLVQW